MPDGYWPICKKDEAASLAYTPPEPTEERRDYFRRYRAANPERIHRLQNRWSDRNRENERRRLRLYVETYPDRVRATKINYQAKRRAQCKDSDITTEWLVQLKVEATKHPTCPLCDGMLTFTDRRDQTHAHVDHIVPFHVGGKHMMKNVRVICSKCNSKRPKDGRDLDPWDWASAW